MQGERSYKVLKGPIRSEELALFEEYPDVDRPRTRADCIDVPRPCPFVSCRHNTYLEASGRRVIINRPQYEPWEVPPSESCSLDVAERGQSIEEPMEHKEIGAILGVTSSSVQSAMQDAQEKANRIRKEMNKRDLARTEK